MENTEVITTIKTAIGKLIIEKGNTTRIDEAMLEARKLFNKTLLKLLNNQEINEKDLQTPLDANTKQLIIKKAKETYKSFKELEKKGEAKKLKIYENKPLPLRMNFTQGYNLWIDKEGKIMFRITLTPHEHVKGYLELTREHEEIVKKAIEEKKKTIKLKKMGINHTPEYNITIAELIKKKKTYHLHITITKNTTNPPTKYAAGIDTNEDNISITIYDLTTRKIIDSLIIDYTPIKHIRHYWFTIRKRLQHHKAKSEKKLGFTKRESRQITYLIHLISRRVANYLSRYHGLIVFMEDLDGIRDGVGERGGRMNKRLHSWPFRRLQEFLKYKLEWVGVPVRFVPPENTSRRCPLCRVLGIRHKKLFKCPNGHVGHADRSASVNILIRGCVMYLHVPYSVFRSMSLPNFRMWRLRRDESGAWGCVSQPLPAGVEPSTAAQRREAEKPQFQREKASSFKLGVVHSKAVMMAEELKKYNYNVEVVESYMRACDADVISTATSSKEPFLRPEWIKVGTHINLIGSNVVSRAEAFPETIGMASLVVTDLKEQAMFESGDLIRAVEKGFLKWDSVRELWEVVLGNVKRVRDDEITIFKSHGIALWDVALAKKIYEKAVKRGIGFEIELKGQWNID